MIYCRRYSYTKANGEGAASGDCFCLTLKVRDNADAVMTRYAQVMVIVAPT